VAHACYPRYSGGRDQEDFSLKPTQVNTLQDSILKKPITKIGLVEWPLVQAPVQQKRKKESEKKFFKEKHLERYIFNKTYCIDFFFYDEHSLLFMLRSILC
jgi:hypothetical protein